MIVTKEQEKDTREIVTSFPAVLKTAISDWAKFKAGQRANLFNSNQIEEITEWFAGLPKLWSGIRPHFVAMSSMMVGGREVTRESPTETARMADSFTRKLGGDILIKNSLGLAPLIIAGIAIAAAFGLIGITWGIGYIRKQANISKLIDSVTAGKIKPEVLEMAIEQETASLFDPISDTMKYVAIGAVVIVLGPMLVKWIGNKR